MAARSLTDVEIFNQALIQGLGQTAYLVSAVDGSDRSKFGKLAYPMYFATRNEELRSGTWRVATKRAQLLPANATVNSTWSNGSANVTVTSTAGILPGWLVTAAIIQGGGAISTPAGIPAGTTVLSITDATHLVMSANATAGGNGPVVYQVNNLTGYWYAYIAPTDILLAKSVAAIFPNFVYLWPFKVQHELKFTYIYEQGYFYTDLDPNNGNPILEYIVELPTPAKNIVGTTVTSSANVTVTTGTVAQTDVGSLVTGINIPQGTLVQSVTDSTHFVMSQAATTGAAGTAITLNPQSTFDQDFAQALIMRLATKLSRPGTQNEAIKKDNAQDYIFEKVRADNNNAKEATNEALGETWWTDRRR